MKSLFSRLRGAHTPPPSRSPSASQSNEDKENLPIPPNPPSKPGKSSQPVVKSAPVSLRSSTPLGPIDSQTSSSSSGSTRPRSTRKQSDGESPPNVEIWDSAGGGRARTVSAGEAGGKKVTFRSPAPTPSINTELEEVALLDSIIEAQSEGRGSKTDNRRNTSASPSKKPSAPAKLSRPQPTSRSSTSQSFSTRPRFSSRQSLRITARKASLPPLPTRSDSFSQSNQRSPLRSSILSPAPSNASLERTSARSYLPPPNSWGEMADEELIANLGPRERTRQEVLWEIVSSEERYVQQLIKLNDTFSRVLLPPSATSPSLNMVDATHTLPRTLSPASLNSRTESFDHLPIAAHYASNTSPSDDRPSPAVVPGPRMEAYHTLTNGRPSHKNGCNTLNRGRSHQSLPPPSSSANHSGGGGFSAFTRMSYQPRVGSTSSSIRSVPQDVHLPEDLETVVAVLAGGILEGHIKLAAALRRRYDDQYPLVRSLADVFTAHSYILREYATYVLHLERALSQVDESLSACKSTTSKRASRRLYGTDNGRLSKLLLSLEEVAAERGESGLVISLSKPFQRLLKYPLLFQNLLFNTDPSLKEYEATLAMVDEVEQIVRTIEDEKSSSEDKERTWDVLARIEGLERDKMLVTPQPNRLLMSESQLPQSEGLTPRDTGVKQKKTLRRLSDILKGQTEQVDLWVVVFSDVSLLCERTGLTHLPVSNTKSSASRSDSLTELSGRAKNATTSRRGQSIKARNLYRLVKVHEWHLNQKTGSIEGLLSMDHVSRARSRPPETLAQPTVENSAKAEISSPQTPRKPRKVPLKGDGGPSPARSTPGRRDASTSDTDTVMSDHLSVASFAFKGSDQIKPKPRARPAKSSAPPNPGNERSSGGYVASDAANAKFANRLRSTDDGDNTMRPTSRTRKSLLPAMALTAANGKADVAQHGRTTPVTKPPWNASTVPIKARASPSVRKATAAPQPVTMDGKRIRGQLAPSPSGNSGVAGLWTADQDREAPRKRTEPVLAGGQFGGRI